MIAATSDPAVDTRLLIILAIAVAAAMIVGKVVGLIVAAVAVWRTHRQLEQFHDEQWQRMGRGRQL